MIYTHISITDGSKILSYLEANELACHNLMDTAKRHETSGSERMYS